MGGDRLCFACSLEHEQLGQDGDGFEVDGERPEDLGRCPGVSCDEREEKAREEEVFEFEGVDRGVRGWSGWERIKGKGGGGEREERNGKVDASKVRGKYKGERQ